MSFTEAVKSVFSKYATFSGRARRSEYWYFCLFNYLVTGILTYLSNNTESTFIGLITTVYSLAVIVPNLAVNARRLHDIGKSGWLMLLAAIPLVGAIILLVWDCKDSQPGPNQYGENPKGNNPAEPF